MSSTIVAPAVPSTRLRAERTAVVALGFGLLALGLLFHAEIAAAIHVWIESTAYNHCFFVIPIAAFLAWERRARFAATPLRAMPVLALLALPLGLAWLAAERLGIMEGRQLLAMLIVQVLVAAVAGWRMWRAFAAPLLYLFFLVPSGAFLTPQLQDFTARFTTLGLDLVGIPNYSDGYTIEIPQGTFYVAEACAGLRFLIASIAFGALYAFTIYRSPGRRVAFLAASVIVPIVANGFRALGIVSLGNVLGSAEAAATDHVLYGWIFFSVVILALTLAGLPFREDQAPPAVRPSPPIPVGRGAVLAAAACVVLAALAPGAAFALSMGHGRLAAIPDLPLQGCTSEPRPADAVQARAPSSVVRSVRVTCGRDSAAIDVVAFSPRAGASAVLGARHAMAEPIDAEDVSMSALPDPAGSGAWRMNEIRDPFGAVAVALFLGDQPAGGGLSLRFALARASAEGSQTAPVMIVLTPEIDWAREGEAGLAHARAIATRVLGALPDLPAYAGRLSHAAADGA